MKLYFKAQYDEMRELAAGGVQPNLNLAKVRDATIPCPPPEEQQRIVELVESLPIIVNNLESKVDALELAAVKLSTIATTVRT